MCCSHETVTAMMVGNSNMALETEFQNLPVKHKDTDFKET